MELDDIKKLIKENLKINIKEKEYSTECSYNKQIFVELIFDDEVISSDEIQDLSVDR